MFIVVADLFKLIIQIMFSMTKFVLRINTKELSKKFKIFNSVINSFKTKKSHLFHDIAKFIVLKHKNWTSYLQNFQRWDMKKQPNFYILKPYSLTRGIFFFKKKRLFLQKNTHTHTYTHVHNRDAKILLINDP